MNNDKRLKIDELQKSIQTEIEMRKNPQTIIELMSKEALTDIYNRLDVINNILNIDKYDCVFIGQVGVGKTTAICHLFQLTLESLKKTKPGNPEREFDVTEELMTTGGGFTTLCEVIVKQDDSVFIEIEPHSNEEVEKTVKDFCSSTWLKTFPATNGEHNDATIPAEIDRAVRNLLGIPSRKKGEMDPSQQIASKYGDNSFNQFFAEMLKKAKLGDRTQKEIRPEGITNLKLWLKETFNNINLVKIPTVSIPRRICVHVTSSVILVKNSRINNVVDTKGVDAGQFNREDIDRFIREKDNSICFITESFTSAPTNVIDLIERHMTKEAKDIATKIILFVMPQKNQPEEVVGQDGIVGDRDLGLSLRRDQIEDTFRARGINFPNENIIFYDPLEFYEKIDRYLHRLQDSAKTDIDNGRNHIFNEITQIIKRREDSLWKEVEKKEISFKGIIEGHSLDTNDEQSIDNLKSKIKEYRHLDFVNADRFFDEYKKPWLENKRHTMWLVATNNRYGWYPYRTIDIYYDAIGIIEILIRIAANGRKEKILKDIIEIKTKSPPTSQLQRFVPILEERINKAYEEFVREMAIKMQEYLKEERFYPQEYSNQFWLDVQDRFGKGPGYRDDVFAMYGEQMGNYEKFLHDNAGNLWEEMVIKKVLAFLE